ncbi:MAG TPA: ABC transporter permease subunit [Acidimicrobiales bacterium]|nr:ABC transporter permease subunit [Acidimicrobiales bacterium]
MVLAQINKDDFVSWEWVFGYTSERGREVEGHVDEIWAATVEHLQLTGIALGVGLVLSILLAGISLRWRRSYPPIAGFAGVLYSIPSLALFAILLPITGLTVTTAEIGLVSYTLLILIRNIVAGVDGVPAAVKEAADGMGYRPLKRFFAVDLRLATPAIIAGIRIAAVTTVGLVTVTFVIGYGGYGGLINDGLCRNFNTPVVIGAGLSIALALAIDLVLVLLERLITPWTRAAR